MRCAKCSSVMPEGSRVCDSCGALVETSSLKLADRLRAANPNGSRRPTGSTSNPGSLKIGARLRVLSQQNEESDEPNPFSFARPKNNTSTTNAQPTPTTSSASTESPFAMREPSPPVSVREAAPVVSAPSESSLFTIEPERPLSSPSGSPFEPPPSLVAPEVPVSGSPFDTPSMLGLKAVSAPPPAPSPSAEVIEPELDELIEATSAEPEPNPFETPTTPIPMSRAELVTSAEPVVAEPVVAPPVLPESKAPVLPDSGLPPALPPVPSAEKKNLRDLIRERAQKTPSESMKAISPSEPAKPSGVGLFKPPPPLSPKPPPLIGSKPKAGLQAPPSPKPSVVPPLAAKVEAPPEEIAPTPPQPIIEEVAPPSNVPSASISESIEIDDLMAEIEEELPTQAPPPPPMEELEAISNEMESFGDRLDSMRSEQGPPPFAPKEMPAFKPESSATSEEPDEFAAALQSLDAGSSGSLQNPFEKPHDATPKSQISENTRLALSLDTAAGAVDDLFGNLVQPSLPVVEAVSAPQPPQATQSSSIELDDSDVVESGKDNPFEQSEGMWSLTRRTATR
jgi:hypothetical protein